MKKLVDFLSDDVRQHGGSASEIINLHGHLMQVTVCQVPWGLLVLKQEVTMLEAIGWWFAPPE